MAKVRRQGSFPQAAQWLFPAAVQCPGCHQFRARKPCRIQDAMQGTGLQPRQVSCNNQQITRPQAPRRMNTAQWPQTCNGILHHGPGAASHPRRILKRHIRTGQREMDLRAGGCKSPECAVIQRCTAQPCTHLLGTEAGGLPTEQQQPFRIDLHAMPMSPREQNGEKFVGNGRVLSCDSTTDMISSGKWTIQCLDKIILVRGANVATPAHPPPFQPTQRNQPSRRAPCCISMLPLPRT